MPPPAYEFRGQNQDKRSRPSHEFTFRFPRPTSERPLLTTKRETTPEPLGAPKNGAEKAPLKFAPLTELTDSDEAEMDVSSDEDGSRPPRKKRAVEKEPSAPPAPKWSNPDPYYVLPPPDESQTKKTDVVKLIRKARVAASAAAAPAVTQTDAVASNEDFISFDMDDDDVEDEDEEDEDESEPPANAPKGPKNARPEERDGASRKRKRTHEDEIKGYSKKANPFAGKFRSDGGILDQWQPRPSENGTPWLELMEPTLHLGTRSVTVLSPKGRCRFFLTLLQAAQ